MLRLWDWLEIVAPGLLAAQHALARILADWIFGCDGVVPWAEWNQGAISIIALVSALWLARSEQLRAITAEARAADEARLSDERERAAARRAETRIEVDRMRKFVRVAAAIIRKTEVEIDRARERLAALGFGEGDLAPRDSAVTVSASQALQSLRAILPVAPLDPDLVLAVVRGCDELAEIEGLDINLTEKAMRKWFTDRNEALMTARGAINERLIALEAMLTPFAPAAPDPLTLAANLQL